jgi:hypothetical protein
LTSFLVAAATSGWVSVLGGQAQDRWGCWDAAWSVPTVGGITQARKRLGPAVLAEVFERVAEPVGGLLTRGARLRGWRLLAIDGFKVDVPDTRLMPRSSGIPGRGRIGRRFRRRG